MAKTKHRGKLGIVFQIAVTLGIFLGYVVQYGLNQAGIQGGNNTIATFWRRFIPITDFAKTGIGIGELDLALVPCSELAF
jgi:hypothetical protein